VGIRKLNFVSVVASMLAFSSVASAREVYFQANATSNYTIDLTSYTAQGTNTFTGTAPLQIGLECVVTVFNPQSSVQTVSDQTDIRFQGEWPTYDNTAALNWGAGTAHPWFYGGNPVTFKATTGSVMASGGSIRKVSMTIGAADETPSFPVDLAQGESLIITNRLNIAHSIQYENGWIKSTSNGTNGDYPFIKAHEYCAGKIIVTDKVSSQSGFVMATGYLQYVADSYQNPATPTGGIVTRTSANGANAVSAPALTWMGRGLYGAAFQYRTGGFNIIGACSDSGFFPVTFPNRLAIMGYGSVEGSCAGKAQGAAEIIIDNNWTRSSFTPAHILDLPIMINGGAPI